MWQGYGAYANIAPMYLAPIWGSVRVLMVIARAYGKFYNRIVETLGRIGDVLPQLPHTMISGDETETDDLRTETVNGI
jgi:hypothetical protein